MKLYFDGASRGNPGEAGCGWVLEIGGIFPPRQGSKYLGRATNNEAEYQGLIEGLSALKPCGGLKVYGDSKLVIEQVTGNWKVKAENLKPLCAKAQELAKEFENIEFIWIKRSENSQADAMANKSLNDIP